MIVPRIFLALFIYGVLADKNGGALLALIMAGFTWWGLRQLDKRDAEYNADPASATRQPGTLEQCESHDCECSRSKF